MTLKKSPGGSLFPYPYKGGELFGLHFGSFGANEDALISLMKAEGIFFTEQNHKLGVWIDFYQTRLSDRVISEFIEFLRMNRHHILRLALVGCSSKDQRRINLHIKDAGDFPSLPVRYFSDPEDAKTWLVSEHG
jgi:hypothetical protein